MTVFCHALEDYLQETRRQLLTLNTAVRARRERSRAQPRARNAQHFKVRDSREYVFKVRDSREYVLMCMLRRPD
jgi:hypothetical protein